MTYIDNDCYIANKGQVKVKVTIIKNKIVGFSLFRVIIIGYWPFIAKSLAGQTVSKFSVFKHWGFQFLNVLGEKYHFFVNLCNIFIFSFVLWEVRCPVNNLLNCGNSCVIYEDKKMERKWQICSQSSNLVKATVVREALCWKAGELQRHDLT